MAATCAAVAPDDPAVKVLPPRITVSPTLKSLKVTTALSVTEPEPAVVAIDAVTDETIIPLLVALAVDTNKVSFTSYPVPAVVISNEVISPSSTVIEANAPAPDPSLDKITSVYVPSV